MVIVGRERIGIISLGIVTEIDLDFIDAFEDFLGVGFDIGPDDFEVPGVISFVQKQVLLKVGNFHIQFCQSNFHMDPDGDDGQQEGKQTDCLWKRQTKYI
jgi:hypothetical protein